MPMGPSSWPSAVPKRPEPPQASASKPKTATRLCVRGHFTYWRAIQASAPYEPLAYQTLLPASYAAYAVSVASLKKSIGGGSPQGIHEVEFRVRDGVGKEHL